MDLYTLRWINAGLSIEQAAKLCHVSCRTYKKWESSGKYPKYIPDLLLAKAGYCLDEEFSGWRAYNGVLISPDNNIFSPGEIRSITYLYALIAELKRISKKDVLQDDVPRGNNIIFLDNYRKEAIL